MTASIYAESIKKQLQELRRTSGEDFVVLAAGIRHRDGKSYLSILCTADLEEIKSGEPKSASAIEICSSVSLPVAALANRDYLRQLGLEMVKAAA